VDKLPSSAAVCRRDPGVEEGLLASSEGQPPPVAATGSVLPANSPLEGDEYEVPWTNNYEDVDDRTYANHEDMVGVPSHVVVADNLGYAVMTSAASSSAQV